ncbi:helix-turn-helix domain-containing protein [[Mycoplasma] testudinis]|uniref:helix-turn-helix domain-containing protein n=1 Tax=[Mycoplasma] testudinis TaxID=33924 RepID=UPI00056C1D10|nr:helix-turn-helix transcriptional regulator [[Mycoplasma] testudinis]
MYNSFNKELISGEFSQKFVEVMKQKRNEEKLTQTELAKLTGISRSTLSKIEISKKHLVFEHAIKIARVLKIPLDWALE